MNRVFLGPFDKHAERFAKVLVEFGRKGHPTVVFVEPQMRSSEVHAYIYRYFTPSFILEMVALPGDKERVENILNPVGVLIDTLSNAQKVVVEEPGVIKM